MASDVNQRACVVEVVEQVAEADVAIVAARVGERLAMAPERVRKLIEGRTGPITRALRADKADAIAQTFEAAGVRVVIRPAEPEELEDLPGAVTRNTAERAAEFDEPEPDDELHEPAHDAEADDDDAEAEVGYDEDEAEVGYDEDEAEAEVGYDEDEAEFAELERQPDRSPTSSFRRPKPRGLARSPRARRPTSAPCAPTRTTRSIPRRRTSASRTPTRPNPRQGANSATSTTPTPTPTRAA